MSQAGDNAAKITLKKKWKGSHFRLEDKIFVVFSFLGVFDDVRKRILQLSASNSDDRLYHPEFLYEAVCLPAYSIGRILSKSAPPPEISVFDSRGSSRRVSRDTLKQREKDEYPKFDALGLLFASEIIVDLFQLFFNMTADCMSALDFTQLLPAYASTKAGKVYLFGSVTRISEFRGLKGVSRSPMGLMETNNMKIAPILKLLPLGYLRVKWDTPSQDPTNSGVFGRPTIPLRDMYSQKFWGKFDPANPNVGNDEHWADGLHFSLKPSQFWRQISTTKIIARNAGTNWHVEWLKVSAAHLNTLDSYFNFMVYSEQIWGSVQEAMDKMKKAAPGSPQSSVQQEEGKEDGGGKMPAVPRKTQNSQKQGQSLISNMNPRGPPADLATNPATTAAAARAKATAEAAQALVANAAAKVSAATRATEQGLPPVPGFASHVPTAPGAFRTTAIAPAPAAPAPGPPGPPAPTHAPVDAPATAAPDSATGPAPATAPAALAASAAHATSPAPATAPAASARTNLGNAESHHFPTEINAVMNEDAVSQLLDAQNSTFSQLEQDPVITGGSKAAARKARVNAIPDTKKQAKHRSLQTGRRVGQDSQRTIMSLAVRVRKSHDPKKRRLGATLRLRRRKLVARKVQVELCQLHPKVLAQTKIPIGLLYRVQPRKVMCLRLQQEPNRLRLLKPLGG